MAKKTRRERGEKPDATARGTRQTPAVPGLAELRQPLALWWQSVGGYLKGHEPEATSPSAAPATLLHLHGEGSPEEAAGTLYGLHESLDEPGYWHILQHGTEESLASFLFRLAASQGNEIPEEGKVLIRRLATECWWEKKDFREVLLCLGMSSAGDAAGSSPSTAADLLSATISTLQSEIPPPPDEIGEEEPRTLRFVVEPCCGSALGGTTVVWGRDSGEPVPTELRLGCRHAAPLHGGRFITPCNDAAEAVDVIAVFADGVKVCYASAFSYFHPGSLEALEPATAPTKGGVEVEVVTSDLGAEICEVVLGHQQCQLLGTPSCSRATFVAPASREEGAVSLVVTACNGNCVRVEEAFAYADILTFGAVGSCVEVSEDGRQARKGKGVKDGVCLSATPVRHTERGFFFQIRIDEMGPKNMRALAVGFAQLTADDLLSKMRARPQEACGLSRAWLLGYDRGGALFATPGAAPTKLPPGGWRPAVELEAGSIIGVLCTNDEMVVFQDGKERSRLEVGREVRPGPSDELHAVVDLQGAARAVSFVTGVPPDA